MRKTKRVTEQKGFPFYRKNARLPVFYRVKRLYWRGEIRNKKSSTMPLRRSLGRTTPIQKNFASHSGFFNLRIFGAVVLCSIGASLGIFSWSVTPATARVTVASPNRQS